MRTNLPEYTIVIAVLRLAFAFRDFMTLYMYIEMCICLLRERTHFDASERIAALIRPRNVCHFLCQ